MNISKGEKSILFEETKDPEIDENMKISKYWEK